MSGLETKVEETSVPVSRQLGSYVSGELPRSNGNVTPAPYARLSTQERDLLDRLDRFEAPYLKEKLLQRKIFASEAEYKSAFVEFKKYAGLFGIHKKPLAMMSEKVDEVWHQFILFTRQYHDFCKEFIGEYMHHIPKTSFTPLDKKHKRTLTRLYKETFGDPPDIWDIKADCSSCNNGCSSSGMCSG